MKKLFVLLLSMVLLCSVVLPAYAAGTVTYDGDAKKFIYAPGSEFSPTDIFGGLKNVMPGDKLTEKITVRNDADLDVKVNIYVRALGPHAGSEEFLSQMHMTVAKSSENEMAYMFDAAADQTDGMTDWVLLGMLYSGGEVNLDVTLEVPITMGDEFQDAVGYLDWQFKVEAFPTEPDDPEPPQTGDDGGIILWSCVGAVAITIVLIPLFSRRRSREED